MRAGWRERLRKSGRRHAGRREVYLKGRKKVDLRGKTAILVDDGIATGLTFEAAVMELRHAEPKKLVAAVPVVPADSYIELRKMVDDFVALSVEEQFQGAVGAYYDYFSQVEDDEVRELLNRGRVRGETSNPGHKM